MSTTSNSRTPVDNAIESFNLLAARLQLQFPPVAPTALKPATPAVGQIDLSWTVVNGPGDLDGFLIERRQSGAGQYDVVAQLAPSLTKFSATGLESATTYSFRVTAFNGRGRAAAEVSATAK